MADINSASPPEFPTAQASTGPGTKRKHRQGLSRNQVACQRCRKKKYKCDGKIPACTPCQKAKETCIISDRITHREYPAGYVEMLEAKVKTLEDQIIGLKEDLAVLSSDSGAPAQEDDKNETFFQHTPQSLDSNITAGSPPCLLPAEQRNQGLRGLTYSRILHSNIAAPISTARDNPALTESICKGVRAGTVGEFESKQSTALERPSTPSKDVGDTLVDMFFRLRWPGMPYLHRPTFMQTCYEPLISGDDSNHGCVALTFLVFAVAAADLQRLNPQSPSSPSTYFRIAIDHYLDGLLAADGLEAIQGLLLLTAYGLIEPQTVNVWHTIGLALRITIDMGINRNSTYEGLSLLDSEMRKRVFWSVYVMERSICFALGRPLGIRNIDIDTELPLPLTDDELLLEPSCQPLRSAPSPMDVSTFVHIIKLRRINVKVQETFFPVQVPDLPQSYYTNLRTELHSQLDEWITTMPRGALSPSTWQSTEWLETAYHYALLTIHRPTPACPQPSLADLNICSDSSISMISLLGSLYAKNKITYAFPSMYTLFMASITMLYTLQASPVIRKNTTADVVHSNVQSCVRLFKSLSKGRIAGERCAQVVEKLSRAVFGLFDHQGATTTSPAFMLKPEAPTAPDPWPPISSLTVEDITSTVDPEFWTWFGIKKDKIGAVEKSRPADPQRATFDFDGDGRTWRIRNDSPDDATTTTNTNTEVFSIGDDQMMGLDDGWPSFLDQAFDMPPYLLDELFGKIPA